MMRLTVEKFTEYEQVILKNLVQHNLGPLKYVCTNSLDNITDLYIKCGCRYCHYIEIRLKDDEYILKYFKPDGSQWRKDEKLSILEWDAKKIYDMLYFNECF